MVRVKVCGLCRVEDARTAVAAGASHIGVILSPHGPRALDAARARDVLAVRGAAQAVGVFVDESIDRVNVLADALRLDVLQLHGSETLDDTWALRSSTSASIWKAIRVRSSPEARVLIDMWAPHVDGILLDGWSSAGVGGTGARFDWNTMRDVRALVPSRLTFVIAGGLRPDNVPDAIAALTPDVVDVSSGVEEQPGIKSAHAVHAFVAAVRAQQQESKQR